MVTRIPNEITVSRPSFCPNPDCHFHVSDIAAHHDWFYRAGTFETLARGPIQRFRCRSCGKYCSTQTFSTLYWTHSRDTLEHYEDLLLASSSLRHIGRTIGHTYRVVRNRISRLSRAYLFLFSLALADHTLRENASFDGFESYLRSQYFPTNIHILVGSESQAIYAFNATVMRRKGRMTEVQKKRRTTIDAQWRPKRGDLTGSVCSLFADLAPMIERTIAGGKKWTLFTDEKREYPRAFAQVPVLKAALASEDVVHRTVSSRAARTFWNPLFPSNYIDRELRKNLGEHVRETVKQGRELNCSMDRMTVALGYHTFKKPRRISGHAEIAEQETHGERAGLVGPEKQNALTMKLRRRYTHRRVWTHAPLKPEWMRQVWKREYENPPIVDMKSGEKPMKGQPKESWFARHLTA